MRVGRGPSAAQALYCDKRSAMLILIAVPGPRVGETVGAKLEGRPDSRSPTGISTVQPPE